MINVINQTSYRIPKRRTIEVLSLATTYLAIKNPDISVVFISSRHMQKLNQLYRQQARPTDVLSFSYDYQPGKLLDGEIFICYNLTIQQAQHYHHSPQQELVKLLVHSLLHLIGYDHHSEQQASMMEKLENKIIIYLSKKTSYVQLSPQS